MVESDFVCPPRRRTMPSRITAVKAVDRKDTGEPADNKSMDTAEPMDTVKPLDTSQPGPKANPLGTAMGATDTSQTTSSEEDMMESGDQTPGSNLKEPEKMESDGDIRSSLDDDLNLSEDSGDEAMSKPEKNLKSEIIERTTEKKIEDEVQNEGSDGDEFNDEDGPDEASPGLTNLQSPSRLLLQKVQYRNLLDELLGDFRSRFKKQNRNLEHMREKLQAERKTFEYQTYATILEKNIDRLLEEVSEKDLEKISDELCKGDSPERNQRMFCDYVFNYIKVRINIVNN